MRAELEAYDDELAAKPEIIALNKCDALTAAEIKKKKSALKKASGAEIYAISAAGREGIEPLLVTMLQTIQDYRGEQSPAPLPDFITQKGEPE